jgi:ribosomal protein L15
MLRKISVGIDIGTYQIKVVVSESVLSDSGVYVPKIIATGELTKKVTIEANAFSAAAREKLEAKSISFRVID